MFQFNYASDFQNQLSTLVMSTASRTAIKKYRSVAALKTYKLTLVDNLSQKFIYIE